MLRFVAPAGAPIHLSQILRAAGGAILQNEVGFSALGHRLNARHLLGVSSGRAALTMILKALHRLRPGRDVVVLPAYTCYTVAGAVVRAGLKLQPVEIDAATLDYHPRRLAELPSERILCILTSNLFGLVNDEEPVRAAAKASGAFVVDDAAQALGAVRRSVAAGLNGDVGFFSFGRGKALAAMEGGIIITNSDDIAAALRAEVGYLDHCGAVHSLLLFCELLVYAFFLHPRLFWIPNSMPFLRFGTTEFDTQFPMHLMPALVKNIVPRLTAGLEEINRIRRENAMRLIAQLQGNHSFETPRPGEGCLPNYIRFPIFAANQTLRDEAVGTLRAHGIGAMPFYPGAISDVKGIAAHVGWPNFHCPAAEDVARRLFTLPTHHYVTQEDIAVIGQILGRMAAR